MNTKFSKFDIRSMQKRQAAPTKPHVIRREVLDRGFTFVARDSQLPTKQRIILAEEQPQFFSWRFGSMRAQGAFALIALAMILFLGGLGYFSRARDASKEILGSATSAYGQLQRAGEGLTDQNFTQAKGLFVSAQNNIRLAQEKLAAFRVLKFFTPQARNADYMLSGASMLAQAGTKLSLALSLFEEIKVTSNGIETANFNAKVAANRALINEAKSLIDRAAAEFAQVSSIPSDYSGTLAEGRRQAARLSSVLGKLLGLQDLYLGFFTEQPKTYLLLFQNYDEARATGGFIGTYGVLKTQAGKIDKLKIESIYNIDGQIFETIAAPGPFQPEIKKWGIRDANWFADFPTSAEKLLYFFEKGGETADGIIMATPQLFGQLLSLTGPIQMSQYNVTLTADNFQDTVQFETSENYDKGLNQPKKFLADFAPILLNGLTNLGPEQWLGLFQALQDNLDQKQILLFSKDTGMQKRIVDLGVSGQISQTPYDYLSIINSNLGGTKTDLKVTQTVNLESKILSDGAVLNTVTVKRQNSASENNRDFIRVMVPFGSQLVSASGFAPHTFYKSESEGLRTDPTLAQWDKGQMVSDVFVRSEGGKMEFSGWVNTLGGAERQIVLTYLLPFKVSNGQAYSLLLQKQSGSKPYGFQGLWDLGPEDASWATTGVVRAGNILKFKSNSASDDFWGVVTGQ